MDEVYLPHCSEGRWAIGREVSGEWIALIQNSPVDDESEVVKVLSALNIELTYENMVRYFPFRRPGNNRCPTLELLELFARLATLRTERGV